MLLSDLPPWIENYTTWWVCAIIVFLGLLVYGFKDVIRFRLKRAWAISSVVFAEAIRRRVLWITPLAIVGVLVVTQLQKSLDEQDAIRQTIKFSLFTAGLIVTITAIILACTNLPKEIETRVIFTIVTKPATRLEIVLGKVIGFAKVSLAILIIMGLFTFGYLHLRAWSLQNDIRQRLAAGAVDPLSRATYEYWAADGLLSARTYGRPVDFQILSRNPVPGQTRQWFFGSMEGDVLIPFSITPEQLIPAGVPGAMPGQGGAAVQLQIGFDRSQYTGPQTQAPTVGSLPAGVAAPASLDKLKPAITVSFLDANLNPVIDARELKASGSAQLTDPSGKTPVMIEIPPEAAPNLLRTNGQFFVDVYGTSSGVEYSADTQVDQATPQNNAACLLVPGASPEQVHAIGPGGPLIFRGKMGTSGEQVRGGDPDKSPVGIFAFRNVGSRSASGDVGFEIKTGIERSGDENEEAVGTEVQITVVDPKTGQASDPLIIYPDNDRTCYFNLPAALMADGNFDVYVRALTAGHFVGLQRTSVSMVASRESFDWNLVKSLSILWMLSILVVIISIFCSTFLSWPIATVLTLVILLGNWGVMQLGDTLAPGIGPSVATDIFPGSPSQQKVVSASVEAMAKMLNRLADVLPDIGKFSAIDDIERGVTISRQQLLDPLLVLVSFGLPMMVVSYIFLRNKEVAP